MTDPNVYLTLSAAALVALGMVTFATLNGWRGWLQLKQLELRNFDDARPARSVPNASARIEIADLKERIRKLEAIAAGVDL